MKKPPRAALVCGGNLGEGPITRFRGLREKLGPVKSSSLRLASRYVNSLRAGVAVADYEAFRNCRLVLISVHDSHVREVVRELVETDIVWAGKCIVLASTALESSALCPLAEKGAKTASLCAVAGFDGTMFLAEGDRPAVAQIRPFLASRAVRLLEVPTAHKTFYLAAAACTGPYLASLLICADECLKLAGLANSDAAAMLQVQVARNVRGFLKAGRKGVQNAAGLGVQLAAIRSRSPELGECLQQYARLSSRLLR